ncbi:MAG: DUF4834 family protein [Bacteroides sp.]|nr:DUF4834 family protein [Bacteroides sp.]
MTVLIAIIVIIYLLWLLKPLLLRYAQRKYQEKINEMFNQTFGGTTATGSRSYDGRGGSARNPFGRYNEPPRYRSNGRRRKIFSRDEGEYVDFEDIEVTREYRSTSSRDTSYTPREPQVSDADWEEIR